MYDYTSNNWSQRNSNQKHKETLGNCTRKTFDRFTTKDSYTWNITNNTESTVVWSFKPERWGSPLVQEKHQEGKAYDKRHPYCKRTERKWRFITSVWSLSSFFVCCQKLYIRVDRTDLFKIRKLFYDARVIVTSLYGNLQKQPVYGRYREMAGWLSVSVKVERLGNFLEKLTS